MSETQSELNKFAMLRNSMKDESADFVDSTSRESLLHSTNGKDYSSWEWKVKYERLFEAHRKLQKTNNSLEDKLLRIVDKFEAEKNQMSRDLASQTQKLVESKLTIQRLHDQNRNLQNDLNLSINLLRNRPNCFVSQRIDSLPSDVRASVKSYAAEKNRERSEGKKIRVAIPDDVSGSGGSYSAGSDADGGDLVSAAILAKVLEERDKERRRDQKFCIDIGTQTHGWHFPAGKSAGSGNQVASSSSTGSGATPSKCSTASSPSSSPSSPEDSNPEKEPEVEEELKEVKMQRPNSVRINGTAGILLTSVIHTGVRQTGPDESKITHSQSVQHSLQQHQQQPQQQPSLQQQMSMEGKLNLPIPTYMSRSVTCSTLQTDI